MIETKKHCNTCGHSFLQDDQNTYLEYSCVQMQHCSSEIYNSPAYTFEMLLEDWGKGYCRLWTPKSQKGT